MYLGGNSSPQASKDGPFYFQSPFFPRFLPDSLPALHQARVLISAGSPVNFKGTHTCTAGLGS